MLALLCLTVARKRAERGSHHHHNALSFKLLPENLACFLCAVFASCPGCCSLLCSAQKREREVRLL